VLQEALNNVARHSGASEAAVRLHAAGGEIRLEVEDHGSGMREGGSRNGIGMVAMRERAQLLRGSIQFSSPAQGGTLVRLIAPVNPPYADA
jgi:signal transduction histidine kinase